MLSDEAKRKYLASGGVVCPYCERGDITADFFEGEAYGGCQHVLCESCGKRWQDELTLTNIIEDEDDGCCPACGHPVATCACIPLYEG